MFRTLFLRPLMVHDCLALLIFGFNIGGHLEGIWRPILTLQRPLRFIGLGLVSFGRPLSLCFRIGFGVNSSLKRVLLNIFGVFAAWCPSFAKKKKAISPVGGETFCRKRGGNIIRLRVC